jgi:hypothetical protein
MDERSSRNIQAHKTSASNSAPGPEAPAAAPAPAGGNTKPGHEVSRQTLKNAEKLLDYAIHAGIKVEPEVVQGIIKARPPGDGVMDNENISQLIAATTTLAKTVQPVTTESLKACETAAKKTIWRYEILVLILAILIIPLSIMSFVMTGISNTITGQLKIANDLAVKLHTQIDTSAPPANDQRAPAGSLSDLQQFAAAMRAIYSRTQQLNWFVRYMVPDSMVPDPVMGQSEDPKKLELPPSLPNSLGPLRDEIVKKTQTYQDVRLYATSVQDTASVIWAALNACFLPVLYASLGACAYLLQAFSDQLRTRTFIPSYAPIARFFIAAIAGMIVGLFSNFTLGPEASVSPLAVAFLVGYAADVFFSFLAQSLPKTKAS